MVDSAFSLYTLSLAILLQPPLLAPVLNLKSIHPSKPLLQASNSTSFLCFFSCQRPEHLRPNVVITAQINFIPETSLFMFLLQITLIDHLKTLASSFIIFLSLLIQSISTCCLLQLLIISEFSLFLSALIATPSKSKPHYFYYCAWREEEFANCSPHFSRSPLYLSSSESSE